MDGHKHPVSPDHPRVLGPRAELQALAVARPEAYRRMADVARATALPEYPGPASIGKLIATGLAAAVEQDYRLARQAVDTVLRDFIRQPIRTGHSPFGSDVGYCGLIYDLCHESWLPYERTEFHAFMNRSRDVNVNEEASPFHNGWYGYKTWGFGLACYATMFENPRAEEMLRGIEREYIQRAVPCLKIAGDGGGFGEGFYTHYWLYPWLFFCEVAWACEGVDYYAPAPQFYRNRAVASLFEMCPELQERHTHCNIPMGDETGGRLCKRDRDWARAARLILVGRFRDDPAHQAVAAFDAGMPQAAFPDNAYLDFLWHDPTVTKGDLDAFKLSHFSPGPGYVYARSSWKEDSSYLFFRCGPRFTAHQHLDQGSLLILRDAELLGDGGHYEWNTNHAINYDIRSIAHNTMLVYDPAEKFPSFIRAGGDAVNDGGQRYPWLGTVFRHNGCAADAKDWLEHPELRDTGTMLAYQDAGSFLYTAGDVTKAYSAAKLESFTRQIVLLRPGTFVVLDRVKATSPDFKKTCLWQAAKRPVGGGADYVINNGPAKLFMQILLPEAPEVVLNYGPNLYTHHGHSCLPDGCEVRFRPEPECRMEVSPSMPAALDFFLHVLTATDGLTTSVPRAAARTDGDAITVEVGTTEIRFRKDTPGGWLTSRSGGRESRSELRLLEA
jgi:hypothetical protein